MAGAAVTLAPSTLLGPRLTLIRDEDVLVVENLGERCAVPDCPDRPEPGAHHIEPRSRTGGPKLFVVIDGLVVPNRCRLCSRHHLAVTGGIGGHTARIVWHTQPLGHWCWLAKLLDRRATLGATAWRCVGPLQIPYSLEVCDGEVDLGV